MSGTNNNVFFLPQVSSRLKIDGLTTFSTPNSYSLLVAGDGSQGTVEINGSVVGANRLQIYNNATAEVNSTVNTIEGPIVSSDFFSRLAGSGSINWTNTSSKAEIYGRINPDKTTTTGILTLEDTRFQASSSARLEIQVGGTTPGTGYDQLVVNGTVDVAGNLDVTLSVGYTPTVGDKFTILSNDGVDAINGTFNGLGEGALFSVGSHIFSISYQGGTGNDIVLTRVLASEWDGGGADNNWSTAANWLGDAIPLAGSNLLFPNSSLRKTNVNDLGNGSDFGSILLVGTGFNISGDSIDLSGAITSQGTNTFSVPLRLMTNSGLANTSGTFTVSGNIDTNGNALSLNATSQLTVSGQISGGGSVTTGGSSTVVLSGNNSYTGITTVTSGTLSVRHNNALGAGTNVAANGTNITNDALVRLENGVTVSSERLSAAASTPIQLASAGAGTTNTWGGSVVSGTNNNVFFLPQVSSRLKIDGLTTFSTPNSYSLLVAGDGAKGLSRSMVRWLVQTVCKSITMQRLK